MQVYATGLVVVLVWMICAIKDRDMSAALIGALLPFGMLNVFRLGGFSFIADDFVAAASVGLFLAGVLISRPRMQIPLPGVFLILLAVYGLIASFLLIRCFAGAVDVFAFNRLYDGARVSSEFSGTLLPLGPTSANVSQTAYLLLDVAFFFVAWSVARRRGPEILIDGLRIGAAINIGLGLMDIFGADPILAALRTADYGLADHHSLNGFARVSGGFSEASAYGARSATFAALFLSLGLLTRKRRDLVLGLLCAVMALISLSSSAIIGTAVMLTVFGVWAMRSLPNRVAPQLLFGWALAAAAVGVLVVLLISLVAADSSHPVHGILDRLIFSKQDSRSGLERSAMALKGFETFWVTWGMGAGLGSVMANGHLSAILAAVGLPGLVLILGFYGLCFFAPTPPLSPERRAIRRAAQCYFLVAVTIALASSFAVSPGLSTIYIAAVSLAAAMPHPAPRPVSKPQAQPTRGPTPSATHAMFPSPQGSAS